MALTKVSTDGVKDDAITKTKIPANQIEASELADNAVDTNAIADQAVALSKLPHGTSSNNGKFLRANNGADPSFETVNTDLVSDTTPQLGGDLDTNSHHIHMDNLHAIRWGHTNTPMYFQMFHESGYGVSMQNGNGAFYIQNATGNDNNIIVRAKSGEDSIKAFANGRVELYYDNAKKLETFDLGVDLPNATGNLGIRWGGANFNYCNIWAEYGSGDLFLAGGLKQKTTNSGFFSSYAGNLSRNAIQIDAFGNEGIHFYASAAQNVAKDSAITVPEKVRINQHGLTFNGDSAAANALDDYEEGTWTPQSNAGSISVYSAHYVKVGNKVTFQAYCGFPNQSGSSSQRITNFPFDVAGGSDYHSFAINSDANLGYQLVGQFNQGAFAVFAKPNNQKANITEMSAKFVLFSCTILTH